MLELARECDRAEINRLARQVHEMHVSWRPDIFQEAKELFPQEDFGKLVDNRELYVAKLGGQIVGYALLTIHYVSGPGNVPRRILNVDQVCVEETLRGHGIGTGIMEDVRALARAFGCTDLQLSVYPQNDEAVGFYQKCGFTIRKIDMQRKI